MRLGIDCHHIEDQEGIRRYTLALLHEWENFGYLTNKKNHIICYVKDKLPYGTRLPESVQLKALKSHSTLLFQQVFLPREADKDALDVLFSPSYLLPLWLDHKIKTALMMHDIVFQVLPREFDWHSYFDRIYLAYAARKSAKKANVILVPSEFTKRELERYWKIGTKKIVVIPLAGNITPRNATPLLGRKDVILFVGSLFNRRHVPQLIEAFSQLAITSPKLSLIIVGKDRTNPAQHIDSLIEKANFAIGRRAIQRKEDVSDEELLQLYSLARCLVLVSDYEGFGLPVLEALSQGTPVLISKRGSLPEVAGEAALYINHRTTVKELAKKLSLLLRDTRLQKDLALKGMARSRCFSWQKTAKATWDILTATAHS